MKFVCYTEIQEKGLLLHFPTMAVKTEILHQWQKSKEKHNCYFTVELKLPYKSRTTGEGSQNNLFYALVTEICKETGNDLEDVKDAVKERAIKRGYPYKINPINNQIKPFSTTQVNTVEMGYLIDEAIQLCAELGIVINPEMKPDKKVMPMKKDPYQNEYDIF